MTLPTFLGIGVPRSGTTWLNQLLDRHPDVYVPHRRKEIHFFDQNYVRGIEWYKKFFPVGGESERYQAIGEITPHYLFRPQCSERIAATLSDPKLILILRNPVYRAFSHYLFKIQVSNFSGSFVDFVSKYPEAIEWGFYSRQLREYFCHFKREQFLILLYERIMVNISEAKFTLANFLSIAEDRFPFASGSERINPSYLPRFRSTYSLATNVAHFLRRKWDLDSVVNFVKRFGIKHLFGVGGSLPKMGDGTKRYLDGIYEGEIRELEFLLKFNLECWR